MKKGRVIAIAVVLALILALGGFAFYYYSSIKSIQVKGARITSISNVTMGGFIIQGEVIVNNPSMLSLNVYESNIQFLKKEGNRAIADGTIKETMLKPKSETTIPFSGNVQFSSTIDFAVDVLRKNETMVVAMGDVVVSKRFGISIPFRVEFDVNKQLKEYVGSGLSQWIGFLFP